ncbi:Protoheme IX farnesyltransferase, mitochondrial [Modicella reniformis]|uniref:Heme O synthase n=1 Tax=Modicella reniformis TaxID=1440133 RepID=A0A9P6ING8_9FUNG|nr:Protoheme IX farnesyltransferase, mitochondrial [Modicella reniformis]
MNSLGRLQSKSSLSFLHASPRKTALKGSRVIFTRTKSSASVNSAAVLPTGMQNIFEGDNREQETTGFFTSQSVISLATPPAITSPLSSAAAPVGFQDYDIRWKEVKKPTLAGLVPIYMDLAKARLGALRMSIANTWVGAIVGAIPPMMGWAACTNSLDPEAWLLGAFLYAWQFPHFNSLAWNLRADYSKAGYRMMAVTDPKLNARVSLRYTLALIPLVTLAPYLDMTSWWFAIDGNIVNAIILAGAANFWRKKDDKSARQLFFGSLIYLPVILALMMIHKKGKQTEAAGVLVDDGSVLVSSEVATASLSGVEDDDDEYEYEDEDEDDEEDHENSLASIARKP